MPPLPGPILETRELTMLMRGILRMAVRVLRTLRQAEGDGRPLSLLRPLSPRLAAKRAVRGGTWVRGHVRKPRWSRSRKLELSEIAIAAAAIWAQLGIRPPFEDNTRIGSLSSASLVSGTNCIGWCYCHHPRNCGYLCGFRLTREIIDTPTPGHDTCCVWQRASYPEKWRNVLRWYWRYFVQRLAKTSRS